MENKSIWLVVVALAFVIFFGMTFFYLGVLNPASPTPSTGYGGEYKTDSMATGVGRYHVYNPLASAGFLVSFIIGIIIFFWSLMDLREKIKTNIPTILAIVGIIFLFMSLYSLVMGLHDLLTFTKYETITKPTFGQQYGWLIQFFVYGIIGLALMYAAEHTRKEASETRSTIPSAATPLGVFLLLSTFLLFVSGFHSFMYLTDYSDYRQSLAWLIETFIFGFLAYFLLNTSEKIRRAEGMTKSIFSFPAASLGVVFLLMTLGVYIFYSFDWIYRDYGAKNINWFVEAVVYAVLGIAFSLIGDNLARKDGEEATGFTTSMFLCGVVLLAPAVGVFLIGFNDFLYSNNPSLKWFYELLLLLIPGILAVAAGEYTRRSKRVPNILPQEKLPEEKKARKKKEEE
jgi:flagellar biosynthesis protein FliQ